MYKIKLTPRTMGSTRNRKIMTTPAQFADIPTAKRWIVNHMRQQEKMAWQQLGLVDCSYTENDNGYVMDIIPALTLFKGLKLTYEIIKEGK